MNDSFELHGVVHLVRPVGRSARHLEALRSGIVEVSAQCLFCHALQPQLRHPSSAELPPDDFSAWVNGVVQDRETAERLSFAIQDHGGSAAELREAMLGVLEAIPEKSRITRDAPEDGDFVFLEVDSVPVPTGRRASDLNELMEHFAEANPSILFYHLVEQPWLEPDRPSLTDWVRGHGHDRLAEWLQGSLQSGLTIEESRRRLLKRWRQSRLGRRVTEAIGTPEQERREAGRRAVAGLIRRITQTDDTDDTRSST